MKTNFQNRFISGLTFVELLVVIAVLVILAVILLPALNRPTSRAPRITCVNNLKQVGLSFRLYAGDNNDRYPTNLSTNEEPVVNEMTPVYQYFQSLSNELGTVKIIVCPSDEKRHPSIYDSVYSGIGRKDFINLKDTNISYFVGLDANENFPNSVLSGDRNIKNGVAPDHGVLRLTTNQMVEFTDKIHKKQGNIALVDGSVQQVSSARLRSEFLPNTGFATNRIKLP